MDKVVFGVDIGGTSVKLGYFSTEGKLIEKWEIPTRTENGGSGILPDIAESIRKKISECHLKPEEVLGTGVGVPGPVLEDGSVDGCVNLGWKKIPAARELSDLLGMPVRTGNDANVAALGEMWQGGGRGYKDVVMVTLGTGVGGGVILNGKIITGADGAAGEIGHLPMEDDEAEACGCGNHGCLEQYGSATGMVRLAKKYTGEWTDAEMICNAAKKGNPTARKILDEYCEYLGKALAMISCTVDPQVFIIGGGVSKAGEFLLDQIREHYEKHAFHACRKTKFHLASLSNDAGIYGAARMMVG